MSNKFYFKIGEIEFNLEGDADYIERERSIFFGNIFPQAVDAMTRVRTVQLPASFEEIVDESLPLATDKKPLIKDLSINEFLNQKGFGSKIDTALGLIYYWEKYCNRPEFSLDDLKMYFKNAKIPVPTNPSDFIQKLIKKGYIQPSNNPKHFTITRSGNEFIEQYQPKEKKDNKTTITRRNRSKTPSAYSELTREDLNLEKYPSLNDFKDFKDKMMLALYIVVKERKGESFTTADVMHIMTDIFGEKVTSGQVNGVFRHYPRWFNETSDTNNKKIVRRSLLSEGINYAQKLINSGE